MCTICNVSMALTNISTKRSWQQGSTRLETGLYIRLKFRNVSSIKPRSNKKTLFERRFQQNAFLDKIHITFPQQISNAILKYMNEIEEFHSYLYANSTSLETYKDYSN